MFLVAVETRRTAFKNNRQKAAFSRSSGKKNVVFLICDLCLLLSLSWILYRTFLVGGRQDRCQRIPSQSGFFDPTLYWTLYWTFFFFFGFFLVLYLSFLSLSYTGGALRGAGCLVLSGRFVFSCLVLSCLLVCFLIISCLFFVLPFDFCLLPFALPRRLSCDDHTYLIL